MTEYTETVGTIPEIQDDTFINITNKYLIEWPETNNPLIIKNKAELLSVALSRLISIYIVWHETNSKEAELLRDWKEKAEKLLDTVQKTLKILQGEKKKEIISQIRQNVDLELAFQIHKRISKTVIPNLKETEEILLFILDKESKKEWLPEPLGVAEALELEQNTNKLSKFFYKNIKVGDRKGYVVGYDDTRLQIVFDDSPQDEPEWVTAYKVKFVLTPK
jgi:hypothetical protein